MHNDTRLVLQLNELNPDWRDEYGSTLAAAEAYGLDKEQAEDYIYDEGPQEVDFNDETWYNPDLVPAEDSDEEPMEE